MASYPYALSNPAWADESLPPPSKLARFELACWIFFVSFLVVGYYTLGKAFAYLGLPQAKLFIGEIFLGLFIVAWPAAFFNTWLSTLVKLHPLSLFAWTHLAFLGYGVLETLRGLNEGYSAAYAILNLVFNVYPIYVFVGFWFARKSPGLIERLVPTIALFNGVYGLAYIAYLNNVTGFQMPGSDVSVFGQPGGSMVSLLGLIILRKHGPFYSFLILANALVLLGTQVRGDWLGFLLGLLVWGALTGRLGQVLKAGLVLSTILGLGLITDARLPAVAGRGGETSAREMVGRALAGVDKETARSFARDADSYAGTLEWRKNWWKEIWIAVHASEEKMLLGLGYGFPLATLVTYIGNETVATRTPHSIFYYALGYSGWLGVLLFVSLQLSIVFAMWQIYRRTGFSLGVAIFVCTLTTASAGNCLENPFGAIPFYTLIGMCAAQQKPPEEEDFEPMNDEEYFPPRPTLAFPIALESGAGHPFVKPAPPWEHPKFDALRREE